MIVLSQNWHNGTLIPYLFWFIFIYYYYDFHRILLVLEIWIVIKEVDAGNILFIWISYISYIYTFISFVFQAVWNKKKRIDKCPLRNADAPQNVEWNTFEYSKLSSSIFIYQYYSRFIPYFWVNRGFLNIFTIGTFAYLQPLSSCENKNGKYEFREQKVWKFWAIWDKNIPFWGQKKFFQNSYQYHLYLLIVF